MTEPSAIGIDNPAFSGRLRADPMLGYAPRQTPRDGRSNAIGYIEDMRKTALAVDEDMPSISFLLPKPGVQPPTQQAVRPAPAPRPTPVPVRVVAQPAPAPAPAVTRPASFDQRPAAAPVTAPAPTAPDPTPAAEPFAPLEPLTEPLIELSSAKPRVSLHQRSQQAKQALAPVVAAARPHASRAITRARSIRLTKQHLRILVEWRQYAPRLRALLADYSKGQVAMMGMAAALFVTGAAVSLNTLQTNHAAAAQVAVLSKLANAGAAVPTGSAAASSASAAAVPSTIKPPASTVASYAVAPDLAKYLNVPRLGVHARVLQVGILGNGSLGTPNNVFDTAWYTGSAKPGQPGATLIDGHVSSWTSHGVFYGIKNLQPGDDIQIVKGDNTVVNYKVVRSQVYPNNNVDMQAAITPVDPTASGLNLITCTGQVIKGTNEFNQRVMVFAKQV